MQRRRLRIQSLHIHADDVLRLQRLPDLAIDVADRRRPAVADASRHVLADIRKDARRAVDAEQIFDPADKPCKEIGHIRLKPLPLLDDALPDAIDDGLADAPVGSYAGQKAADDRLYETRHSRDDVPGVGHKPGRQRDDDLDAHADDLRHHRVKRLDQICDDARYGVDQLRDRRDKPAGECQHQLHRSLDQQRDRLRGRDRVHDA